MGLLFHDAKPAGLRVAIGVSHMDCFCITFCACWFNTANDSLPVNTRCGNELSTEPSLSKHQFVDTFQHHFVGDSVVPSLIDVRSAFARDLLANLARRHGLSVHSRSQYPLQPRPFDLTPRDMSRLVNCMVTPNRRIISRRILRIQSKWNGGLLCGTRLWYCHRSA